MFYSQHTNKGSTLLFPAGTDWNHLEPSGSDWILTGSKWFQSESTRNHSESGRNHLEPVGIWSVLHGTNQFRLVPGAIIVKMDPNKTIQINKL